MLTPGSFAMGILLLQSFVCAGDKRFAFLPAQVLFLIHRAAKRQPPTCGAADLHDGNVLSGSQNDLGQSVAGDEIGRRTEAADRDGAALELLRGFDLWAG